MLQLSAWNSVKCAHFWVSGLWTSCEWTGALARLHKNCWKFPWHFWVSAAFLNPWILNTTSAKLKFLRNWAVFYLSKGREATFCLVSRNIKIKRLQRHKENEHGDLCLQHLYLWNTAVSFVVFTDLSQLNLIMKSPQGNRLWDASGKGRFPRFWSFGT